MAAKKRTDHMGDAAPLTNNPFASLTGSGKALEPPATPPEPSGATAKPKASAWRVARARKGGWKLSLVKRAGGKSVTVLEGVQGDSGALVKALRKHCGAGGAAVGEEVVEIQGDHRATITHWLDARGGEG